MLFTSISRTFAVAKTICTHMTKELIYIFIGGGTGSVLRFCTQMFLAHVSRHSFPWGTLTVNVLGCFLIGVFYALSERFNLSPEVRLLLTTGLCGGYTTFSTFGYESLHLLKSGNYLIFAIYMALSIIIGIAATFAGAFTFKH